VTEFATERLWKGDRPPSERTLIANTVATDEFVGFGTWKHREPLIAGGQNYGKVIDIAYLGIVSKFQGEVDHDGYKLAARLYASLEDDARASEDSTDEMLVHLVCDDRNQRALTFWERNGFVAVESKYIPSIDVTYVQMIRA
jgi:hypothetical protein